MVAASFFKVFVCLVELETNLREAFTSMEKTPSIGWLE